MEKKLNKFVFKPVKMVENVEVSICSLIQSYCNGSNEEIEALIKKDFSSFNVVLHARVLSRSPQILIIETSKFNTQIKEYRDHEIWVFNNYQTSKITLNRYRV